MSLYAQMRQHLREFYPLYIDGRQVSAANEAQMEIICPADGSVLCTAAQADTADVDLAVAAARAAFPAWRAVEPADRCRILTACHQRIMDNLEPLCSIESLDEGRPYEGSKALIRGAAEHFLYYASLIRTQEDGFSRGKDGTQTLIVREPFGVVGAICAWNGPLTQSFWKIAPALAAGNCVVLKPSSYAPLSVLEMAYLLGDLLPAGVLNVVNGPGSIAGQHLLDHPDVDILSITGSVSSGITAGIAGAKRVVPVTMELGGKSAGIYFEDADLDKAAQEIARHAINNSGQVCRMQSRALVEASVYEELLRRVTAILESAKIGPPWEAGVQMGPLCYEEHMNQVLSYIELGKQEGARLVTGGYRLTDGAYAQGCYVAPTLFADVDNSMRIAREEVFGPVICMIPFHDEEEAVRIANDSPFGLGAGIFTQDLKKALRVAARLEAGDVRINGAKGRSHGGSAFGGYKKSGIGRENYKSTFDFYSQLKTISF